MTAPSENIQNLIRRLQDLGVEPQLLQRVSVHLAANYQDPDHWGELAATLRRLRNYCAAEVVYNTALSIHPGSARLWNNYGVLLRDWGKLKEALVAFDHAIGVDSSYAKALSNKGNIFERLHRFAEARTWYMAALNINPTDAASTNNIGVCFLGEGEAKQAEVWFEKTIQLDANWTNALFNLALLKLDEGDVESAQPLVGRLSQLLPDDTDVKRLEARIRDQDSQRPKLEVSPAQTLETELSPALRRWCDELAGNPRSVFISYAWSDPSIKLFASRLSQDLQSSSFQVVLDQEHDLEVSEVLTLLVHCQNVVVLNDTHYAESCLLGKVPVSKPTSAYPSFAFPRSEAESEEYLGMVFKISAVTWELARQMKESGQEAAGELAFLLAKPDEFENVPGLRTFVEGWRVDEIQMVFTKLKRLRSISVAYLGGEHCLAGYPLFDFSRKEY